MSKEAFVTLATNDSYGLGALVLGRSLRRVATAKQTVVMVTPDVSQKMKEELGQVFNLVVTVDTLDSGDAAHLALMSRPELGVTFTKLHAWRLVQFSKCVFLDADTLVVQNCDELFERDELSAAPDPGWPDCFNSGVFVFVPSETTFKALMDFAVAHGSFDGGDQGLLNMFFREWATVDIKKHLPFVYNLVSSATYSYLPALKFFGSQVKIVHFLGSNKPWLRQSDTSSSSPYQRAWWSIFREDVASRLSQEMAGVAGSLASGAPEDWRREAWEAGDVDYLGRDSFDNIWKRICECVGITAQAPVPAAPKAPTEGETKPTEPAPAVTTPIAEKSIEPIAPAVVAEKPDEVPPPEKTVEAAAETKTEALPVAEKPAEVVPALEKPSEATSASEKPAEVVEKPVEPVVEKPVEAALSAEKPAEVAPPPEKPTEAAPAPEKTSEAVPAPEKPTEAAPAPATPVEAVPASEKPIEAAPAPEKLTESAPAQEKPTDAVPAPEKPTEAVPAPEKPTEAVPAPEKPTEAAATPEKTPEAAPVSEKTPEAAPAPEKTPDAAPAPEKTPEAAPAPEKTPEAAPASDKPVEVTPVAEKPAEVSAVPEKPVEAVVENPVESVTPAEKPAEVLPVTEKPSGEPVPTDAPVCPLKSVQPAVEKPVEALAPPTEGALAPSEPLPESGEARIQPPLEGAEVPVSKQEPGTPTVTPPSGPSSPQPADIAPEVCKLQATASQPATPPATSHQTADAPVPPKRKQGGKNGKPGKGKK